MTTLTLQPDAAAGNDTWLWSSTANTSYANDSVMYALGSSARSIVKFTGLVAIPGGAVISAGTLSLWPSVTLPSSTLTISRVLSANSGWVAGATHNYANPTSIRWAGDVGANGGSDAGCSVSGTDYSSSALCIRALGGQVANAEVQFTLDATQLAAMVAGNYGFVIVTDNPSSASIFYTSNSSTAGLRPKLVVEYTVPGAGGILQSAVFHSGIFGTSVR